jgi:peptidoglycan/xylan/chitin deacetylase (PgdA/CDA1 family)
MRAILTYHSIDDSGSAISITLDVFKEHVHWMSQRQVHIVSLDELLATDVKDPADTVAITFDDGFANFMQAAELLTHHGLPVTLFVVTGRVGGTNAWGGRAEPGIPTLPLLGWSELEHLVGNSLAIGVHTRTHARLTTLPSAAVEDEMDGCSEELRARLGVGGSYLAYPYGAVDDRVAKLAASRFAGALTTRFSPLTDDDPRMWLPRLDMYYFRQPGVIRSWGTARFARRLWSVRARRRLREVLT